MMKKTLLLVIFVWFMSCTSATIYKKPDDLIPKEEMVNLLVDIYLANAAQTNTYKIGKSKAKFLQLVYRKHKIDSARFKRSNLYYTSDLRLYKYIYARVLDSLDKLEKYYKVQIKLYDSVRSKKRDSIKKSFLKRKLKNAKKKPPKRKINL